MAAFEYGFATLAEVKRRLGISNTDTTDDTLLQELLYFTAGMIESAACRPLLRCHVQTEYFSGGGRTIQVQARPIATIHSIRESETRDFDDSDNYEELVEGTDYVLDPGRGNKPGNIGVIRRLNVRWLGSTQNPGKVQVIYTGGYKTDDEIALENGSASITGVTNIQSFSIGGPDGSRTPSYGDDTDEYFIARKTAVTHFRGVCRFDLMSLNLLPVWGYYKAEATLYVRGMTEIDDPSLIYPGFISPDDPLGSDYDAVFDSLDDHQLAYHIIDKDAAYAYEFVIEPASSADFALIAQSAARGFIAYSFDPKEEDNDVRIASEHNPDSGLRPKLELSYRNIVFDLYNVPPDLRNANLLQAIFEYKTRQSPHTTAQAMRGVAIASGASHTKPIADLLPEVRRVAMRYCPPAV